MVINQNQLKDLNLVVLKTANKNGPSLPFKGETFGGKSPD